MAIDLLNLQPQKISKNLRGKTLLIYGEPGCGKTTLASKFKNVLIAGFECGQNALNNVYVQPVKTWNDWKQMVSQLCRKEELKSKFDAIAADTVDEAWQLCSKFICSQNGVENLKDLPWGQGFDLAKKEFSSTFRDLVYNGYGLIFISHSIDKTYKDEKGQEFSKIVPALPARPFDIVNKMVDLIAYIREINVGTDDNPERKRFMFFRDLVGDRFLAKSRYKYIEPKIELDYDALVNAIYDAIDKEVQNSGGEATEEANVNTVLDFDILMDDAKALWGKVIQLDKAEEASKILEEEFGKPTRFSEITSEQIEKLNIVIMKIKDIL